MARRAPGRITYGSIGNGSSQHLAGALFAELAGVELMHVPYRAAVQLLPDLVTGRLDSSFQLIPNMRTQLQAGGGHPLGVMAQDRLTLLPEVPTIAEEGGARAISAGWFTLMAGRGIPSSIVDRMRGELAAVMAEADTAQRLADAGFELAFADAPTTAAFIQEEAARWGELVRRLGIKPD